MAQAYFAQRFVSVSVLMKIFRPRTAAVIILQSPKTDMNYFDILFIVTFYSTLNILIKMLGWRQLVSKQ